MSASNPIAGGTASARALLVLRLPSRLLAVLLTLLLSPLALADKYEDALASFRAADETAAFFAGAYGYALFPTIGKGGIGIGGAHGSGRVYADGVYIGDTKMTQLTVGFQLGGQAYSQIVFFEDKRAVEEFISGNFEFSAQATAVALTAGVSAEANTGGGTSAGASGGRNDAALTHGGYRKGMAIFTIARGGLMYEASLGGQKFSYTPLP
jgi:lipid-binding SYLF domain-containing protein